MKIGGFQKTTLLDFPGHLAAIVFTSGCNFRCPYCHNASLALGGGDPMSEDEVIDYLKLRRGVLDGVSISGGEPLLQKGLVPFILRVRELGLKVKIDTNGSMPSVLGALLEDGLIDYVAMDIKGSRAKYQTCAGVDNVNVLEVDKSIHLIMESGVDYEFRTTVTKELHSENDIADIADWIKGAKRYYLQTFKDTEGTLREGMTAYSEEQMTALMHIASPLVKEIFVR